MLFGALLFTMMVPGMVLLIPQFIVARDLGLLNTLWGLILVYSVMNLGAQHLPPARLLREHAPGAVRRGRRRRRGPVAHRSAPSRVPLSRPGLATVTIFSWLLAPGMSSPGRSPSCPTRSCTPCPSASGNLQGAQQTEWGLVFAASLMALAPVLVLFVALQQQFVSGAFVGATKG